MCALSTRHGWLHWVERAVKIVTAVKGQAPSRFKRHPIRDGEAKHRNGLD
jgi:hypothetical protein